MACSPSEFLFFFLAAMLVNRFVVESRRQTQRYQEMAETLAETNRRLEQAQAEARRSERLAALGQLSAGLAHEIRNPLGVIKGSAEMLTQKLADSNPLATELAGYISTETNRLSALVTRFLDFARPLHADLRPADISAVLDRALNDVAQFWKGAPVRVEKELRSELCRWCRWMRDSASRPSSISFRMLTTRWERRAEAYCASR